VSAARELFFEQLVDRPLDLTPQSSQGARVIGAPTTSHVDGLSERDAQVHPVRG
jgi:hypothetical protein